jgi:hypothetical protein
MKLYKLTSQENTTYNGTTWGEGVTHEPTGFGLDLCSNGWLHAYEHPLIAVLLNPAHANFSNPKLWEAEGEVGIREGQLKCGSKRLTTIKEIPLPRVTTTQLVAFAVLVAKAVCDDEAWNRWADGWLSGKDRSQAGARAAAGAAEAAEVWAGVAARAARAAWAARAARAADLDLIALAKRAIAEF